MIVQGKEQDVFMVIGGWKNNGTRRKNRINNRQNNLEETFKTKDRQRLQNF